MKQPTPDRWHAYMHECAERCRRQLAAAAHARGRPRITSFEPRQYQRDAIAYIAQHPPMTATEVRLRTEGRSLPGHERPLDWFESTTRKGCTDE